MSIFKKHKEEAAKVIELQAIVDPDDAVVETTFISEMPRALLEKKATEYGKRSNHLRRCLTRLETKMDDAFLLSQKKDARVRQLEQECAKLRAANEERRERSASDAK